EDLLADIRSYRESVQVDPARLTEVAERLHALKGLQRKYGEHEEAILVFLQQARQRLAELEDERGARSELEARTTRLGGQVASLAASLTDRRQEAAPRLAAALAEEVQHLGMPGATVRIELIANAEFGPDGAESAEIRFAGGPKQQPLPLARTASGGELSRMMLACRTVLSDLDDVPTLVFDEVDAGIGGRTAQAVGARLAHLASRRQVVVVTHLAQIAAPADRHFVVSKENGIARVRQVDGEQRVEEIARMLSGTTGDVSLAHARELIGDEGSRRRRVRAGAGGVR
ncbi:MAG TPA: DNA repair protein RecN, partial [Actinomycetota bacterium]